jgi:hypothetical protein
MMVTRNLMMWVLAVPLVMMVSLAQARTEILRDPYVLVPPKGITLGGLDKAIDQALAQRQWSKEDVSAESPRVRKIGYSIRKHKIVMKLEYDVNKIQLTYVSSENLNYEQPKYLRFIHPKYNTWVKQLVDEIELNIKDENLKSGADASVK